MAALVRFDVQARWGETVVCEGKVRAGLAAVAVLSATAQDAGLPTLDGFIDQLLVLQGHEAGA